MEALLATFDREGFVDLGLLLAPGEVEQAVAALGELVVRARGEANPGSKVTGGTLHLDLGETGSGLSPIWEHPRVLDAVHHHLGPDAELNRVSYRAPKPGHGGQALHVDHPGPVQPGAWRGCNALVALVDLTERSGTTRVVPRSHLHPDPRFQARSPVDRHRGERRLTGPAGSVFVFSAHVLHSGTRNESEVVRHALLISWADNGGGRPLEPLDRWRVSTCRTGLAST